MSDEQHTALPWKLGPTQDTVEDANGIELLRMYEIDHEAATYFDLPYAANAAFIVRAVNNHAALLAALKELLKWSSSEYQCNPRINAAAEAAIAKAEEE
jgi:hypothetical protein